MLPSLGRRHPQRQLKRRGKGEEAHPPPPPHGPCPSPPSTGTLGAPRAPDLQGRRRSSRSCRGGKWVTLSHVRACHGTHRPPSLVCPPPPKKNPTAWSPTSINPAHPVPRSRGEVWEGRGAAHPHPLMVQLILIPPSPALFSFLPLKYRRVTSQDCWECCSGSPAVLRAVISHTRTLLPHPNPPRGHPAHPDRAQGSSLAAAPPAPSAGSGQILLPDKAWNEILQLAGGCTSELRTKDARASLCAVDVSPLCHRAGTKALCLHFKHLKPPGWRQVRVVPPVVGCCPDPTAFPNSLVLNGEPCPAGESPAAQAVPAFCVPGLRKSKVPLERGQ